MVKLQEGMEFQQKCGNLVVLSLSLPTQVHPRDIRSPKSTSRLEGCKYRAFVQEKVTGKIVEVTEVY